MDADSAMSSGPDEAGRDASLRHDLILFGSLLVLGAIAANINVRIPNTQAYFELRWAFGLVGVALIRRTGLAFLLTCLLCIVLLSDTPVGWVFYGNMSYMLPTFIVVRLVHARWLLRLSHPIGYAAGWFLLVMVCYQILNTPMVWGVVYELEDKPFVDGMLAGWREQPYLIESLLVALISSLGMAAYRSHAKLRASEERQRMTLDSIGDAVIATDNEGRIQTMNPVAERLTGWTASEADRKSVV
jgi:PAS domain-containing protein